MCTTFARLLHLIWFVLLAACSSTTSYRQAGPGAEAGASGLGVVDPSGSAGDEPGIAGGPAAGGDGGAVATGGAVQETGGTAASGAPTGGAVQETGGAAASGAPTGGHLAGQAGAPATGGAVQETGGAAASGAPTGGAEPTGGGVPGGSAGAPTEGGSGPECTATDAVVGLPTFFAWQDWSVRDEFGGVCAQCEHDPCGTASVSTVGGTTESGVVVSLTFGDAPVLIGGVCGAEASSCQVEGTSDPTRPRVYVAWELIWDGAVWRAVVARDGSVSDNQCRVNGEDFEPWAFPSMRSDLVSEVADWLEAIEWPCP